MGGEGGRGEGATASNEYSFVTNTAGAGLCFTSCPVVKFPTAIVLSMCFWKTGFRISFFIVFFDFLLSVFLSTQDTSKLSNSVPTQSLMQDNQMSNK